MYIKDHWRDPLKEKGRDCRACHGRGIVMNAKGEAQRCPLCLGSGKDPFPLEGKKDIDWISRTV